MPLGRAPFTLKQSDQLGVPRHRTKSADLRTPSRMIRVPKGGKISLVDRCRPYTDLTNDGIISHLTAAHIHGFDLPRGFETQTAIDLSRPREASTPRRKNVNGHRLVLTPEEIRDVEGVPVTSIQRTWLDLADILALDDLVVVGDQIVCCHHRTFGPIKRAMVPLDVLKSYVADKRKIPGLARARDALDLIRVGVDSPPETRLRLLLQRAGLPVFIPDFPINDVAGHPAVWPDLGCAEYATCVEYDGEHHLDPKQQSLDHERDALTTELEWHQAKIYSPDLRWDGQPAIRKVARMLVRGGWPDPDNLARLRG